MADGVQLPYTLQTSFGMVIDNGRPKKRQPPFIPCLPCLGPIDETLEIRGRIRFPDIKDFGQYLRHDWSKGLITDTVVECLRLNRLPPNSNSPTGSHDRFKGNVTACRARITADDLRRFIATKTRLDLEQAAGVVVAAFMHENRVEDAAELVQELEGVLATSCMWIDDSVPLASRGTATLGVKHLCEKLPRWCARIGVQVDPPQTMSALIHLLLRFRRHAPPDRCLHVPEWMFEESGLEPPDYMKAFFTTEFPFPTHPHTEDVIILSRKTFRALQRCIFRLFRFWKPECRLRRDINTLNEQVLFATDWVEKVTRSSKDIAQLCYYFFNLQRRLQLKVVSNIQWTRFLARGEGGALYQNNLQVESTFEKTLERLAGRIGKSPPTTRNDIMNLVERTCLLMKAYVDVHGNGRRENLVFQREVSGGRGRGPVDEYNLLVDILREVKSRARDTGVAAAELPGPVPKFLAKDIMSWNNSWKDDAFADGKVPGWESWLQEREVLPQRQATLGCRPRHT